MKLHKLYTLLPYKSRSWMSRLQFTPKCRLKLAQLPTPVHSWNLLNQSGEFKVSIKRDDLTGCAWSGNKIRKLEFLLADCIDKKCGHVITCGGVQSNHARATIAAATELGLQSHLVLRTDEMDVEVAPAGNQFINQLFGASIYLVPKYEREKTGLFPRMIKLKDKLLSETGISSYVIGVGGSNKVGVFGYLEAFDEMLQAGDLDNVSDIVCSCGSGGSTEGLAIANYLTGSKFRIHGVTVCDNASYFYKHINSTLQDLGVDVRAEDIVDIIDGYKGEGYGIASAEVYEFMRSTALTTGIVLDQTYTAKAALGMVTEMKENPDRFLGKNILFIHTGGLFGAMAATDLKFVKNSKVHLWPDKDQDPG